LVTAVGILGFFVFLMTLGHTGIWPVIASFGLVLLGVFKWAYEPAG